MATLAKKSKANPPSPSAPTAYVKALSLAEKAFRETGCLPDLRVSRNCASGASRVGVGDDGEDGLRKTTLKLRKRMTTEQLKEGLIKLASIKGLPEELRRSLIKDFVLWKWSAGLKVETKYQRCRFWSDNALKKWRNNPSQKKFAGLRHEHTIPRGSLFRNFFENERHPEEKIRSLLKNLCIGCVITIEEDKKFKECKLTRQMPEGWDKKDVWARYRIAFEKTGITIHELIWHGGEFAKKRTPVLRIPPANP